VGIALLVPRLGSLQFMWTTANEKDWFNSPCYLAAAVHSDLAISFFIPGVTEQAPCGGFAFCLAAQFSRRHLTVWGGLFCMSGVNISFPLVACKPRGLHRQWAGFAVASGGLLGLIVPPSWPPIMIEHQSAPRRPPAFAFCVFGFFFPSLDRD